MATPTMKIFYGPPGAGKTFGAVREAVRIIDGAIDDNADAVARRHRELVDQRRIRWVTFHPSYAYEDFVEGYRPRKEDTGLTYVVTDGPFKQACEMARESIPSLSLGEKLGDYEITHIDSGGVVLRRSENRRKDAVTETQLEYVDFWSINHLREKGFTPSDLSNPGKRSDARRNIAKETELPTTFFTNSSRHRALWERLDALATGAGSTPVVLVIDEINRADLSRVFGELLTLIEIDKREGAREEARVTLPYSGIPFAVPQGLSIIGTMNTADKSLAVLDVALRRRFEFVAVEPEPDLCVTYAGVDIPALLREWNRRVTILRSRDYRLGHSELMRGRIEELRKQHGWSEDDDGRLRALAQTVRSKVLPLLLEYFPDDWRKANAVLGGGLISPIDAADLRGMFEEELEIELPENVSFEAGRWWDPRSNSWSGSAFRDALNRVHPRARESS